MLTHHKRIGLLGGTFDPVHNGHLAAARHVRQELDLDVVLFIPAASPPHKSAHDDTLPISRFADRAAMLDLALAPYDRLTVSRIEAERPTPSYSIDTLRELRQRAAPAARVFFIVGADAFVEIETWKQYSRLPDFADLVIVSRAAGHPAGVAATISKCFADFRPASGGSRWSSAEHSGGLIAVAMEPVAISSTMVRQKVRENQDIAGLVPAAVAEYIRQHHLYRPAAAAAS